MKHNTKIQTFSLETNGISEQYWGITPPIEVDRAPVGATVGDLVVFAALATLGLAGLGPREQYPYELQELKRKVDNKVSYAARESADIQGILHDIFITYGREVVRVTPLHEHRGYEPSYTRQELRLVS